MGKKTSGKNQAWHSIFKEINQISWDRVIKFNYDISKIKGIFYKTLLKAWQELYFNETFIDNIWKQPVKYN